MTKENLAPKTPIIIAAYDEGRGIGYKNDIPWMGKIKSDMKHFKDMTMGNIVVMGANTHRSLEPYGGVLLGRENRVVSRSGSVEARDGITVYDNLFDSLEVAPDDERDVFIIGGESLYLAALQVADKVIATEIQGTHEVDRYFPELDNSWQLVESSGIEIREGDFIGYSINKYAKSKRLIDVEKANRSLEQKAHYEKVELSGVCPFCPENQGDEIKGEVVFKNDSWMAFQNMAPLKGSSVHYTAVPNRHVEHIGMLSHNDWEGLFNVVRVLSDTIKSGGLGFRFGDMEDTAASVAHLHAHLYEVDADSEDKLSFKISR